LNRIETVIRQHRARIGRPITQRGMLHRSELACHYLLSPHTRAGNDVCPIMANAAVFTTLSLELPEIWNYQRAVSEVTWRSDSPVAIVLIIGASRGIGLATVKRALKAGHTVRAMSRSATTIRMDDPHLEKLRGNARDRNAIQRALVGVDAVIQSLGISSDPALIVTGTHLFSFATRILVRAMEASTVRRLI